MSASSATELRAPLRVARELLDDALVGLRTIDDPRLPLAATEGCLTDAIEAIYRAMHEAGDAARSRAHSSFALERTRDALMCLQHRETHDERALALSGYVAQGIGELIRAGQLTFIGSLGIPRGDAAIAPPASVDLPRRVSLPRGVISPAAVLPKPDAPPAPEPVEIVQGPPPAASSVDLDALRAQTAAALDALDADDLPPAPAPKGSKSPAAQRDMTLEGALLGVAQTREEVLFERARVFFEELSMMGLMRRPDEGDVWHEMLPIEQRLLARLDAVLTVGPWVLPRLVKLLEERPVADPELFWGAIFVHGSLVGDDALDAALRLARSADLEDPELFDAVTDALATIPHEGVESAMRSWTRSEAPTRRAAAAAVLGRRNALTIDPLLPLLDDPEITVVREAAKAMVSLDGALPRATLDALLLHGDHELAHAAMSIASTRGELRGVLRARDLVLGGNPAHGHAALHLAAGCTAEMLDAFRVAMTREPSAVLSEALGWAGLSEAVPYLLDRADAGDPCALRAAQRITGASLTEDDPTGAPGREAPPFTERAALPDDELVLLEDPDAWRRWWRTHGHRAAPTVRWRHGRPWTLSSCLRELAERDASPWERTWAWHELVARTRRAIPFDPRAWVVTQRGQVNAWREYVALRRDLPDGAWSRGGAR